MLGRGGGEGGFRVKSLGFRILGLRVGDGLVTSLKGPRTQYLGPFKRIHGDLEFLQYTGIIRGC